MEGLAGLHVLTHPPVPRCACSAVAEDDLDEEGEDALMAPAGRLLFAGAGGSSSIDSPTSCSDAGSERTRFLLSMAPSEASRCTLGGLERGVAARSRAVCRGPSAGGGWLLEGQACHDISGVPRESSSAQRT